METFPQETSEMEILISLLKKHGALIRRFTRKVTTKIIQPKNQIASLEKSQECICKIQWVAKKKVKSILEEASKMKASCELFENFSLRTNLEVGDEYETITGLESVFGDDQNVTIERKNGQILIILFWASWLKKFENIILKFLI